MPPIRPALTLLATIVVLSPAATARAAAPSLTPNPPVPLPDGTSTTTTTTTTTTATSTEPTGAIPRTGDDLPEQLLVAGVMIAAGAAIRTRRPANRE